jgi:hypothetical protein
VQSPGFGRLFAILVLPLPKHNGGPIQMGKLNLDYAQTLLQHLFGEIIYPSEYIEKLVSIVS